jgi:hypothetical protein
MQGYSEKWGMLALAKYSNTVAKEGQQNAH